MLHQTLLPLLVHAHLSAIHDHAVAALDGVELDGDDCEVGESDKVDRGDNVDSDGAAVDAKESVVLWCYPTCRIAARGSLLRECSSCSWLRHCCRACQGMSCWWGVS